MKFAVRVLLAGGALWVGSQTGCNQIFGVSAGMTGGGTGGSAPGAGGSGAGAGGVGGGDGAGGAGGCADDYAGDGFTTFTDVSNASVPTKTIDDGDSVRGSYFTVEGFSELLLTGNGDPYCDASAAVFLSGEPHVGMYTVGATSPFLNLEAFNKGNNAYVYVTARLRGDGGCDPTLYAFGSVGGAGTVNVSAANGRHVAFTVEGVQTKGIQDPDCAGMGDDGDTDCEGMGTLQVDVAGGVSNCFQAVSQ